MKVLKGRRIYERPFKKKGFSLIEFVFVIVIIGVLATVAFGRTADARGAAYSAKLQKLATSISVGSYTNYMAKKSGAAYVTVNFPNVCQTWLLTPFLSPATWPADFNVRYYVLGESTDCSASANNESVFCQVQTSQSPWNSMPIQVYCAR